MSHRDRRPTSAATLRHQGLAAWSVLFPVGLVLLVLGLAGHVPAAAQGPVLLAAVAVFALSLAALVRGGGTAVPTVLRVD